MTKAMLAISALLFAAVVLVIADGIIAPQDGSAACHPTVFWLEHRESSWRASCEHPRHTMLRGNTKGMLWVCICDDFRNEKGFMDPKKYMPPDASSGELPTCGSPGLKQGQACLPDAGAMP